MSGEASSGWVLHSLAQGRKFGPMTEDELRNYFRAGMVKSVDRLTAPGDFALRSAAEVAAMLGVPAPAGPPPPEITEAPTPLPSMATAPARDPSADERAARAIAAMNIDFAALAASSSPAKQRSGWLVPVVAAVGLIAMLFIALNMLRKMAPTRGNQPPELSTLPTARLEPKPAATAAPAQESAPVEALAPSPAAAAATQDDAEFMAQFRKADVLKSQGDWAGLAAHARAWSEAQPERNEPLQFLAIASSSLGNYQQAIEALQKILKREPDHASAQSLLADAYLQAQRWAEAAGIYRQMVAVKTDDSRLWNNYGVALGGAGQQPQAAAALETAVRLDPGFKKAWTNLGNVYQQMGDSARASAAFANAK